MFEASDSSIYYLSTQVNVTFEELLRGNQSFGGFLEDNGFVAIPSPMNPGRNGNSYFRYDTCLDLWLITAITKPIYLSLWE